MSSIADQQLPATDNVQPDGEAYAPAFIEIAQRFSFHTCIECGLTFAMPAEIYLRRLGDKGRIYCPGCGALEELKPLDWDKADALVKSLAVLVDLRQARHDADRFRAALARMPRLPVKPVSEEEVMRRIKWFANRANYTTDPNDTRTPYGKAICWFCESKHGTDAHLRRHLKIEHRAEIEALPADHFT